MFILKKKHREMLGRGAVEKLVGKSTHCPRCIGLGLRGGSVCTHIGQYLSHSDGSVSAAIETVSARIAL